MRSKPNNTLRQPAVSTKHGGVKRSGAVVTPVGEKVIELYHSIEGTMCAEAQREFQAIARLTRLTCRPRGRLECPAVDTVCILDAKFTGSCKARETIRL